jgi:hypothetical protein
LRIAVRHCCSSREHHKNLLQFSLIVQNFCTAYEGKDTLSSSDAKRLSVNQAVRRSERALVDDESLSPFALAEIESRDAQRH